MVKYTMGIDKILRPLELKEEVGYNPLWEVDSIEEYISMILQARRAGADIDSIKLARVKHDINDNAIVKTARQSGIRITRRMDGVWQAAQNEKDFDLMGVGDDPLEAILEMKRLKNLHDK